MMEMMRQVISNSLLTGLEICVYDIPIDNPQDKRDGGTRVLEQVMKALQLSKSSGTDVQSYHCNHRVMVLGGSLFPRLGFRNSVTLLVVTRL